MTDQDPTTNAPMTPELQALADAWNAAAEAARQERRADLETRRCFVCRGLAIHTINGRRYCSRCAPSPPAPARTHVTAQMIADIWQDGRREEVARILEALPHEERNRLETEYLKLLRARGHRITLHIVKRQFQLVIALPEPANCDVERLAA